MRYAYLEHLAKCSASHDLQEVERVKTRAGGLHLPLLLRATVFIGGLNHFGGGWLDADLIKFGG